MNPTQAQVMAALGTVIDPDFHKDLVTLGMMTMDSTSLSATTGSVST